MISIDGKTYTVIICNNTTLDLPNPMKVRVNFVNVWLYKESTSTSGKSPEEEDALDFTKYVVGTAMEEDIVPSPTHPTQNEVGSSNDNRDRWEWVQSEIQGMKVQQSRKIVVLDDVQLILEQLMLRFPYPEVFCDLSLSCLL